MIPQTVLTSHSTYCDYNQRETDDTRFMVANNHPHAGDYQRLRARFDSLSFAVNSQARFISYGDEGEQAEFWAPDLDVAWGNSGYYPAQGQRYMDWLGRQAAAGWADIETGLNAGRFHINTAKTDFITALTRLCDVNEIRYGDEPGPKDLYRHLHLNPENAVQVEGVFALIEKHHKDILLPTGLFAVGLVPMREKTFRLANVDDVSITGRAVLAPLIPITRDLGVQAKIVGWAERMLNCVAMGLDPEQPRAWLQAVLADADVRLAAAAARFVQPDPNAGLDEPGV
jgi:hypothetical protein